MKLNRNMGTADRIIRTILAVIFAGLYFTGVIPGLVGLILLALSAVFLLTSLVSFCPLYTPFRFSTVRVKNKQE